MDNLLTVVDMHLIRGSSLTGFTSLVTAYGGDPDAVLALANLDPDDLANPWTAAGAYEEDVDRLRNGPVTDAALVFSTVPSLVGAS